MKIKQSLLVGLSLFSASAMADTFNHQIDLYYQDQDLDAGSQDQIKLMGHHYLNTVDTANTAWDEAEFMGRGTNINWDYTDTDGDDSPYGIGFEYYGDSNNNLYAALRYQDPDTNADEVIAGEFGYFVARNTLVAIATSDADDAPIVVRAKHVAELGNGQFFNVEASIDDEENDVTVSGDYYWSPQTSIGLTLTSADAESAAITSSSEGAIANDYALEFKHYFNSQVAVKVGLASGETTVENDLGSAVADVDTMTIGFTGRF